jgi:dimethylargininase
VEVASGVPQRLVALVREVSPEITRCELTHLDRVPIDLDRARAQHAEYVAALEELGCEIEWLPPEPALPDGVFVEDTALVLDDLAIITRPGAESRQAELPSVAEALGRYRTLHRITAPGTLDGGDVLRSGRALYVGQTRRTNEEGISQLAAVVTREGYAVCTMPVQGCLHLKSAATALDDRTVLIHRGWTSAQRFAGRRLVDIDPAEPFAGNALAVGGAVIHAAEFPRTRAILDGAGYRVRPVPASELAKAEGGVTCCSLIVPV